MYAGAARAAASYEACCAAAWPCAASPAQMRPPPGGGGRVVSFCGEAGVPGREALHAARAARKEGEPCRRAARWRRAG